MTSIDEESAFGASVREIFRLFPPVANHKRRVTQRAALRLANHQGEYFEEDHTEAREREPFDAVDENNCGHCRNEQAFRPAGERESAPNAPAQAGLERSY